MLRTVARNAIYLPTDPYQEPLNKYSQKKAGTVFGNQGCWPSCKIYPSPFQTREALLFPAAPIGHLP